LLVTAILGHRKTGQGVHGDTYGHTHPDRGDLLDDLEVDLVGLSAAAVLLGIREGEQT